MKWVALLLLFTLTGGCAAQVTHPTKSLADMQVDIDGCTTAANRKYWMDPVAALYNAYDCLEDKGYERADADVSARVKKAVSQAPAPAEGSLPCRVPCSRERGRQ